MICRSLHAHPRTRHLRDLHGLAGRAGQGTGPPGDRFRRQRLPPHEHPAASPGHRADAGLRSGPPGAGAGPGSDRQRPVARQSGGGACPEQGPALRFRPAVAGRPRAARTLGAGGGRYPRQDHHHQHARLGPGARRHEPGLPDRRGAAELRGFGAPGRYAVLRGRGRRVRQRLLRQALEVRPLPPAHGDPEQPGIRPRGYLPRPRGHRAAVPPSGAHRAGRGPDHSPERRESPGARTRDGLLDPGADHRRRRPVAGAPARRGRLALRGAVRRHRPGRGGLAADRPAQRRQRPRQPGGGAPCRRGAQPGRGGTQRVPQRQAAHGEGRGGPGRDPLRRLRPPSDRHRHHPRRPAQAGWRRYPGDRHRRAAFQLDEARRSSRRPAGQRAPGRPGALVRAAEPGLGPGRHRRAMRDTVAGLRYPGGDHRAGAPAGQARRASGDHEQRRLRRRKLAAALAE